MSVREWMVEILSRAASRNEPVWIPVQGLDTITLSLEAQTQDGSAADSLWAEPYVIKRSGKITLSGKPAFHSQTGSRDPGQAELTYFASLGGCAGDACLRLTDPYGRAQMIDLVITDTESESEGEGEKVEWTGEIVGAPEDVPYVQLTAIAPAQSEVALRVNEAKTIPLSFTPANASNRRFTAASENPHCVRCEVQDEAIVLTGVAAAPAPVTVRIRSMNNALTASMAVTVT